MSDRLGAHLAAVQVKARRDIGSDGGWHMKKKHTHKSMIRELLLYCFVDFGKELSDPTQCWIIPSATVADVLASRHKSWYDMPGKGGKPHIDHDMRRLLPDYGKYKIDKPLGWRDPFREARGSIRAASILQEI